jgi:hypothetical protein
MAEQLMASQGLISTDSVVELCISYNFIELLNIKNHVFVECKGAFIT